MRCDEAIEKVRSDAPSKKRFTMCM
jgi:hypothetical protein